MKEHLEGIEKSGAALYLEGKRMSAEELAKVCCVNEEAVYLADYVLDEAGRLTRLCYDRVRQT